MAITFLDLSVLTPALQGAWRKNLNTNEDPANGRWFTTGPDGSPGGLYGALSDQLAPALEFDQPNATYISTQVYGTSTTVNNMNGLTGSATANLSMTHQDSTTTTTTISHSLSAGISTTMSGECNLIVAKGKASVTISLSYTFSWSESSSTTSSDEQSYSVAVPVTVPAGKIYKAVLLATQQRVQVPYTAKVFVDGMSYTWFEDRQNGHYDWIASAANMFHWIAQYNTAGDNSASYQVDPTGRAMVVMNGTMVGQKTVDFSVQIYDITDTPVEHLATAPSTVNEGESAVPHGTLVDTINSNSLQAMAAS